MSEDKKTVRILVVDDHPIIRQGLSQLISQEDVILRIHKGQLSLFDDFPKYKSRKKYREDGES